MKFHFKPNLDDQLEAIGSVCDLFRGQVLAPVIDRRYRPARCACYRGELGARRFQVIAASA